MARQPDGPEPANPPKDGPAKKDRSEYHKQYGEKNAEKIAMQQKAWREENPEKVAAYREDNKEKNAAQQKKWRKENP